MSAATYQGWMTPGEGEASLNRMLVLSVVLHLGLLALVVGVRLTPKYERPMSSYQVSLVTLPSSHAPEETKPVEQPLTQRTPEPPPAPQPPAMRKAVKPAAPKVAPVPVPVLPQQPLSREPDNFMQDVLRGIEQPPAAPTLGAAKPAAPPKLRQEMDKLMQGLEVPKDQEPAPETPRRKSISEELARLQPPVTAKAAPATVKKPETAIKVPGLSANWYLAQVQNKISSKWVAPPIDLTGASFRVTIKFRLYRNGEFDEVSIETPSGNSYYDDAGRRAILKSFPLPEVPQDMSVPLDVHFSFAVGEGAG
jgi:TonB family protein